MYLTDERFLVYDDENMIFDSFPAIIVDQDQYVEIVPTLEEYEALLEKRVNVIRPFRGCVVSDYYATEWLLKKSIRNRAKIHPKCKIAVSPVSGEIELSALKTWYHKWYDKKSPELVWEPIALCNSLSISSCIIISLRFSMIEITEIYDNKIIRYNFKDFGYQGYITELRNVNLNNIPKKSFFESILTVISNNVPENYTYPIFFTSSLDLEFINDVISNRLINILPYNEFCQHIINGLVNSPIIEV